MARKLEGTVKEVLGTCQVSLLFNVDLPTYRACNILKCIDFSVRWLYGRR